MKCNPEIIRINVLSGESTNNNCKLHVPHLQKLRTLLRKSSFFILFTISHFTIKNQPDFVYYSICYA